MTTSTTTDDRWSGLGADTAKGWERHFVPRFRPWAQRLVDAAAPTPGQSALDIACSTGLAARLLAARVGEGGHVSALDNSPSMLEVAQTACADVRPAIAWQLGDALDLPYPSSRFDLVVSNQGLHFVGDPVLALEEMHRVLKDGGGLALGLWCPMEHQQDFGRLVTALEQHLSPQAGGLRCVASPWQGQELIDLVTEAGFGDILVDLDIGEMRFPSVEECLYAQASGTPLGAAVAPLDEAARAALIRKVATDLEDLIDDDGFRLVFECYRLTAAG